MESEHRESARQFELYPREISGLRVSAMQTYPIVLSNGRSMSAKRHAEVKAAVDTETGDVRFYIDLDELPRLMNAQDEPAPAQSLKPKPSAQ